MTDLAAEEARGVWSGLGSEFDLCDAVARRDKPGFGTLGCGNGAVEEARGIINQRVLCKSCVWISVKKPQSKHSRGLEKVV